MICQICGSELRKQRIKYCSVECKNVGIQKHGHAGVIRSPEWMTWRAMVQRCEWTGHKSYADYGGRGITVCARWRESFSAFLEDMGARPSGSTIDRVDNNGNYEPGNCRWATAVEQAYNRRSAKPLTLDGLTLSVADWARACGIGRTTLGYRLATGMSLREAMAKSSRRITDEQVASAQALLDAGMSPEQASASLGLGRSSARRLVDSGRLKWKDGAA